MNVLFRRLLPISSVLCASLAVLHGTPIDDANARIRPREQAWLQAAQETPDPTESPYDRIVRILGDGSDEYIVIRGAHNSATGTRSHQRYYQKDWDLSELPPYQPEQQVSGTVRIAGTYLVLGSVGEYWKKELAKFQPNLKVEVIGDVKKDIEKIDIETGPRMADRFDELSEYETRKKHPVFEINWATGSYDVPGWSPALAIFVSTANPLKQLTVAQLDGIFGGARRGGWAGTTWRTDVPRSAVQNIRTWGQLGLTGDWSDRPVHVYGRPLRNYNIQRNFEREVLMGGDLWNDNIREYAHEVNPDGTRYISSVEMVKDLGKDKYGIAFSDMGSYIPEVKLVAVAGRDGGPFVDLNLENLRSRAYPLFLAQWAEVNREPGQPLEPKLKEFLRFMLSREGQQAIQQDGKWLPLPTSAVREQLATLDQVGVTPNPAAMGLHQPLINVPEGNGDGVDELHKVEPKKSYYEQRWDLSDLPAYSPQSTVAGVLRLPAEGYLMSGTVGAGWMKAFSQFHPQVTFELVKKGRLVKQSVDLQTGRKWLAEYSDFDAARGHPPLELQMATGSYDVPGWSPAIAIVVNAANPLAHLTMEQLDGIFGGARRGGWIGATWRREIARGPEKNVRTWGQVGLTGEWNDMPIHVYGRPIAYYITRVFENRVFSGGNVWNDNLREYPNRIGADGQPVISVTELIHDLKQDPLGIGYCDLGSAGLTGLKVLAIAPRSDLPFAPLTPDAVRDHSYPLALPVYAYVDHSPGTALDPRLAEFLRFILSREGQAIVQADGKWLPLTPAQVAKERRKLP